MDGSVRLCQVRVRVRKLALVPAIGAAFAFAVAPAEATTPTSQGMYSSGGEAPEVTQADPPAWGRPTGVQSGRRPR